jgi:predicted Zn-dependent protease
MKPEKVLRALLFAAAVLAVLALFVPTSLRSEPQIWDSIKRRADQVQQKTQKVQEAAKPMTVQEEQGVGREVAAKVIAYFHLYANNDLTRYVNMVGETVALQSERQDIKYHFAVLNSDSINAFSAPGGYVFITRGAVALCGDESELAGVLAHEVGHVAGKHVLHIVERDKMMRAGMNEASAYVPGSDYLQKVSKNILVKLLDQGLAPGDEFDADNRGVKYAHAAGYPAGGLERFLAKLDQATNQGANSFWTRTHPPVSARNPRLQKLIADQHWEDTDRPKLEERFAAETQVLKPKAGS